MQETDDAVRVQLCKLYYVHVNVERDEMTTLTNYFFNTRQDSFN